MLHPFTAALGLSWNNITNASLYHLSQIKTLLSLDLHDCTYLNDEGMQYLTLLTNLQCLDLSWCKISVAGVKQLTSLKKLKQLALFGCKVTEKEIKSCGFEDSRQTQLRVLV